METKSVRLPVAVADGLDQDYARQYHEDFVKRWDELIDWNKRAQGEGAFFIERLLRDGACRVFDASTGSGFHAAQLCAAGFDVVACDGSPTMVRCADANFKRRGLNIPLHCYDWRELDPRLLGTFDAVLCLGSSFCHLFDGGERIDVLRQFRQLLKPGGTLLIDQRNFQAILAGHFSSSGRYYYCGKGVSVSLGELNPSLCEFVYTFADGACYRLRVFPILPSQLRQELAAAGFSVTGSWGDFASVYDPLRADFIIHQATPA
ncbi:class I SAM-dependent methyltransferase [Pseudomonas sp. GD03842]|uniref:class I SAM-dependent methyltransferase n=1 Tax=Pseudomonas sp. GD03842 TaxID=2975385 RepID=UPI00244D55F4|nr:class I SAM-dependent methyltransferase [Pseudomonas sp. GD03842]MDH0749599.1 class I SAM-dependent methyltransferase [Pseudomonas sp. GD03842]